MWKKTISVALLLFSISVLTVSCKFRYFYSIQAEERVQDSNIGTESYEVESGKSSIEVTAAALDKHTVEVTLRVHNKDTVEVYFDAAEIHLLAFGNTHYRDEFSINGNADLDIPSRVKIKPNRIVILGVYYEFAELPADDYFMILEFGNLYRGDGSLLSTPPSVRLSHQIR